MGGSSLPANFLVDVTLKGVAANATLDVWTGSFARSDNTLSYNFDVVSDESYNIAYKDGKLVTTRGSESICLTNFVAPAPIMNEEASALAASNAVELSSRDVAILGATRGLVCKAGRVFQVDAFGMTYAVCMVNGLPKTVYGDEVTITLSNWRTGAIQMPTGTDCLAIDPEQRRLDEISSVDGHDMSSVNEFWWRETGVEQSAASKKCGFVHGLGGDSSGWNKKKPKGVGWQTNKCKKRTYLNWPATTWQWKVWWQRVGVKNQVNDKDIIFAHSMGNVMMIRCATNGGGYAGCTILTV